MWSTSQTIIKIYHNIKILFNESEKQTLQWTVLNTMWINNYFSSVSQTLAMIFTCTVI